MLAPTRTTEEGAQAAYSELQRWMKSSVASLSRPGLTSRRRMRDDGRMVRQQSLQMEISDVLLLATVFLELIAEIC